MFIFRKKFNLIIGIALCVGNLPLMPPPAYAIPNKQITNQETRKAQAYLAGLVQQTEAEALRASSAQSAADFAETGKTRYAEAQAQRILEITGKAMATKTPAEVRGASLGDAQEKVAVSLPGDDTKYYWITPRMVLDGEKERLQRKPIAVFVTRQTALQNLAEFYKQNPAIKFYAPQTINVPDVSAFFPILEMIRLWSAGHKLEFKKDRPYRFIFTSDAGKPVLIRENFSMRLPLFRGRLPSNEKYGQTVAEYVQQVNQQRNFRGLGREQSLLMGEALDDIQSDLDRIQGRLLEARINFSKPVTISELLKHHSSMENNFAVISNLLTGIGMQEAVSFLEDYQEAWSVFFNGVDSAHQETFVGQAFQDYMTESAALLNEATFVYERVSGASLGREEEYFQVETTLSHLTKPVHLFIGHSDYSKLSDLQKKELYGIAALNPKTLKVTIYGAKQWEAVKDTGIEFVTEKPQEVAANIKPGTNNLHLSKQEPKVLENFASVKDSVSFFRYQNDERGLLSAALLLSQAEDREAYTVRYGFEQRDGFFVAVSEFLQGLIEEYHSRQTVAIAA